MRLQQTNIDPKRQRNNMKTYLVTGAAGFIGSNFVKYVLKQHGSDVRIIVLDALTYAGNLASLDEELKLPQVSFVKGDIVDTPTVKRIFDENDIDYVVNFAAESHVDRSITNPRLFLETNILGTQNLLDCARQAWFEGKDEKGANKYREGKKYLQISTDEVYGSLPKDFDEAQPLEVSQDLKQVIGERSNLKTFGKRFSLKIRRWLHARLTRLPRPAPTSSRSPTTRPTGCPSTSHAAVTTMGLTTSLKSSFRLSSRTYWRANLCPSMARA